MGQKYFCFWCLQDSTDPNICTHCGEEIGEIDFSKSMFVPPVDGYVSIDKPININELMLALLEVTSRLEAAFGDRYEIENNSASILVRCNDVEGQRLISELERTLSEKKIAVKMDFKAM